MIDYSRILKDLPPLEFKETTEDKQLIGKIYLNQENIYGEKDPVIFWEKNIGLTTLDKLRIFNNLNDYHVGHLLYCLEKEIEQLKREVRKDDC